MREQPGYKEDSNKEDPMLVLGSMFKPLREVIKLATFGAKKYGPDNWQKLESGQTRYMSALQRHLLAELEEGPGALDKETGLHHMTAVAWNALAYMWFILQNR